MDSSYETTTSFTESSPLLDESSTPAINDRDRRTHPGASIFAFPVFCILFIELCERLTFYSISANLVLFATDHLDMKIYNATVLAFGFHGICYIVPILGGWLADSKVGKYAVILFSGAVYLLGTFLILLGSIAKTRDNNEIVYIAGLILIALGTGGIKANVILLGAEQVSHRGPAAVQAFFSWFYCFINIGTFLAYTLVVYLQQNVSFFYGNLVPPCSLILALIIFRSGKRSYILHPPAGSVLADILNIMKEAIKRSRRPSLSSSFVNHWLDRAKLCFGGSYSSWEVEDVKKVYRLLPIFGSLVLYRTVYGQIYSSMLYQGDRMNNKKSGLSINIPIGSLALLSVLGSLVFIPVMEKFVYPLLARCKICPSQLQRIGLGMIIATASMACAGVLELYRVKECCMLQTREGNVNATEVANMTILYQVPQYTLVGLSEVFTVVTALELVYTEAPKYLQGVIMGVFFLAIGVGAGVGAALVVIVKSITEAVNGEDGKWFPDKKHVNKSPSFAYYFFLLAGLMFLNFIVYIFVALSFNEKKESASRTNMNNEVMNSGESSELSRQNEQDGGDWTSARSATGNSFTLVSNTLI